MGQLKWLHDIVVNNKAYDVHNLLNNINRQLERHDMTVESIEDLLRLRYGALSYLKNTEELSGFATTGVIEDLPQDTSHIQDLLTDLILGTGGDIIALKYRALSYKMQAEKEHQDISEYRYIFPIIDAAHIIASVEKDRDLMEIFYQYCELQRTENLVIDVWRFKHTEEGQEIFNVQN